MRIKWLLINCHLSKAISLQGRTSINWINASPLSRYSVPVKWELGQIKTFSSIDLASGKESILICRCLRTALVKFVARLNSLIYLLELYGLIIQHPITISSKPAPFPGEIYQCHPQIYISIVHGSAHFSTVKDLSLGKHDYYVHALHIQQGCKCVRPYYVQ